MSSRARTRDPELSSLSRCIQRKTSIFRMDPGSRSGMTKGHNQAKRSTKFKSVLFRFLQPKTRMRGEVRRSSLERRLGCYQASARALRSSAVARTHHNQSMCGEFRSCVSSEDLFEPQGTGGIAPSACVTRL